ncbi:MAG: 4-(cytidine 5'-diphospho)-2-C-methyl-D-erythritol kinase [Dehalococcoidia bacterium]|nr:4-(cytidine 5'-diphospho)-2-C-methyl-D-erythritol kinase [Dehalococcoidia bacterium]
MISLDACAKINLTLEGLGKRSDGFHEIRSVMQSVSLCDRLVFEDAEHLEYHCAARDWVAQKSLVSRAAQLLARHTGVRRGAKITLDKRIPLSSGLGGDSSDAVAVMRGLARLWCAEMPTSDLISMSAKLGSDLPFFFGGGTALAQGRGDLLRQLPDMPRVWLVLLFPNTPCVASKTAAMYSMLRSEHFTHGEFTDALTQRLAHGAAIAAGDLFNVFEKVAFTAFAGLESCKMEFQRMAGVPVHLAGAGPILFALFSDEAQACRVQQCLQDAGMSSCLAHTCCAAA